MSLPGSCVPAWLLSQQIPLSWSSVPCEAAGWQWDGSSSASLRVALLGADVPKKVAMPVKSHPSFPLFPSEEYHSCAPEVAPEGL